MNSIFPLSRAFVFIFFIAFFAMSCSKDNENPVDDPKNGDPDTEEPIDENPDDDEEEEDPGEDVETIAEVDVPGSTAKAGNLPAPSGDLYLSQGGSNIYTIKGKKLRVYAPVSPGVVAGFYLKIEGTDYYYDISGSGASSGRIAAPNKRKASALERPAATNGRTAATSEEEEAYFIIDLSDGLGQDTLCISYSYYNSSGSISNSVSKCVIPLETGGDNSEFLSANAWEISLWRDYLDDELVYEFELTDYASEEEFDCENGSTVLLQFSITYDDFTLSFFPDGTGYIYSSTTLTEIDYEASVEHCTPVFELITEVEGGDFIWSYDDDSGRLAVIYINEHGEVEYIDYSGGLEIVEVEMEGDNLVVIAYFEGIGYDDEGQEYAFNKSVTILIPKE